VTIVLADADEAERTRRRLEQHGHPVDASEAGLAVRDPSGNALLLTIATEQHRVHPERGP
jgi:hypothetical protein